MSDQYLIPGPDSQSVPGGRWRSYGCLALSMALVGVYVAMSRPLMATIPLFLLGWMRFGIGGIAMLHWMRPNYDDQPLSGKTRRLLWLESFFGNFLFTICMLLGVSMTTAVAAGIIMASIPAVVAMISWIILGERIGPRIWIAIACAVIGISMLALAKATPETTVQLGGSGRQWLGNLLVFGAVVCEAIYAVVAKMLSNSVSPKRVAATINLYGFLLMTPLGAYAAWSFQFSSVPVNIWLLLVFYALAASVWTVWLWMSGLPNVPAAHAGLFTVMLPVAATLTGILFLNEPVRLNELVALAIAVAGVVLATLQPRSKS